MDYIEEDIIEWNLTLIRKEVASDLYLFEQGAMSIFECMELNIYKVKFLCQYYDYAQSERERRKLSAIIGKFKKIQREYHSYKKAAGSY